MVFNGSLLVSIVFILIAVWLLLVSFFVFRLMRHYNRLMALESGDRLKDILDTLLSSQKDVKKSMQALDDQLENLEKREQLHIQNVGIVRFNPFLDTGGSQSFTLALLDASDTGIVMTSLYARSGNRWYIKHVKVGKGVDVELSKEEEHAIKKARPLSEMSQ